MCFDEARPYIRVRCSPLGCCYRVADPVDVRIFAPCSEAVNPFRYPKHVPGVTRLVKV
jgi:hypothetical protein